MKYKLLDFNFLDKIEIKNALFNCCGSTRWVEAMMNLMPFENELQLFQAARDIWYNECREADYLEAFTHHPKIGDKESLRSKFAATSHWASNEQAGVNEAAEQTLDLLAKNNEVYFQRNGYIFIICATGKTASEMSDILAQRLKHSREEELAIAKGEQFKITLLRLQKLIQLEDPVWSRVSQLTSHVLDTSIGKPGKNITIRLKKHTENGPELIGIGITNHDGRVAELLPAGVVLAPGNYQMCFNTGDYYAAQQVTGFYPAVNIDFTIFDASHYHVPLLLNPFGYSTYRGS